MRRLPNSWNRTMAKLGLRRDLPRRKDYSGGVRSRALRGLEVLEDRRVLATLTVTNTTDVVNSDSSLSLREAIEQINARSSIHGVAPSAGTTYGSNDTIILSGLSGTIQLGSTGQIQLTKTGKITGPSASALSIVGHNTDGPQNGGGNRVFEIVGAGVSTTVVEISGVTITGGDVTGDGGGILANDATLFIHDAKLFGNHAEGALSSGGGLAIRHSTATLTRVEISNNSSDKYGGGVDSYNSNLTINDHSLITLNNPGATGAGFSVGGGVTSESVPVLKATHILKIVLSIKIAVHWRAAALP